MEIPQELKELSKRDLIRIILDLQRRLALYENAHTPPSKKGFLRESINPDLTERKLSI